MNLKNGLTRKRVPFDEWEWTEEVVVLSLEYFSFGKFSKRSHKMKNNISALQKHNMIDLGTHIVL